MPHSTGYQMTLAPGMLRHLGIGMHGSVPAALSEAVANAWDADAGRVSIRTGGGIITVEDDGCGMTVADANEKYLRIGYERRKEGGGRTPKGRPAMGRKGIGNLSLFSIADTVTVYSARGGERHGFTMRARDMNDHAVGIDAYRPDPIDAAPDLESGTRITLSGLKRAVYGAPLKRRLARRFSIIGEAYGFEVAVNGDRVGAEDTGYENLQYVWIFGGGGRRDAETGRGGAKKLPAEIAVKLDGREAPLEGWIGTAHRPGQLWDADTGESMNRIAVMARGRVVQDDMLGELAQSGAHGGCIVGEIHADFVDADDDEDIVPTGRPRIRDDAPRYVALRDAVRAALSIVEQGWNELRSEEGSRRARDIPEINRWYEALGPAHRSMAKSLFGRINRMPVDDGERRRLLIGGALAFESLGLGDAIDHLARAGAGDSGGLDMLRDALLQLDDLEASAYYQTARGRLGVIAILAGAADGDGLEMLVQKHLFDHLWLLDPSWERAAGTERMEAEVNRALDAVVEGEGGHGGRLDIRYRIAAGQHIVIELKRPGIRVETGDLITQISKYDVAVQQALHRAGRGDEPVEFVCVVGEDPADWGSPRRRDMSEKSLAQYSARIVKYGDLVRGAQEAYREYTEGGKGVSRVYDLVMSIGEGDRRLMRPPG